VQEGGGNRNRVPARVREDPRISRGALDGSEFAGRQWHGSQQTI
jgi:hypothetical protein